MFLIRLLFLPVRLLWVASMTSLRLGRWTAGVPLRVTARTYRLVGARAVFFFLAGLAVGLLFAPGPGAELRQKLRRRLGGVPPTDTELAEKVGFELSHAPRTWHLPQPEVAVLNGRVELRGTVPTGEGRDEFERVAASVPGVTAVENLLRVEAEGGEPG